MMETLTNLTRYSSKFSLATLVLHTQKHCNSVVITKSTKSSSLCSSNFLACLIHQGFSLSRFCTATLIINTYTYVRTCLCSITLPGVVIITTPASPLPIELVATTENV